MSRLQESRYSPQWQNLLEPFPTCPLGSGSGDAHRQTQLTSHKVSELFAPNTIRDPQMADCCLAGAWLLFNYLDESHSISQRISTREGSFWHAIMHRREGDFGNSKYWYRQAGVHTIYGDLHESVQEYLAEQSESHPSLDVLKRDAVWSPDLFVDLCAMAMGNGDHDDQLLQSLKEIAMIEWRLLFDYCYQHAIH